MKWQRFLVLWFLLTLFLVSFGHGQSVWVGGPGNWSNANGWCPTGVPNGVDVTIGNCKQGAASVVTEDISGFTNNLTIDNAGNSLTVPGNVRLTINGSSISNAGTLALSGINLQGEGAQIVLSAAAVTLSGGGSFVMNDAPNIMLAQGTVLTIQQTIQGAGQLNFAGITNQALIDAQGTNPLNIGTQGNTVNPGTMQASHGGTLILSGTSQTNPLNNIGGTIQALDGSSVLLENPSYITGGTLTTAGSGVIHGIDGGISNLTNSGLFQVGGMNSFGSAVIHLGGTITNTKTIQLGSASWGDDGTEVDGGVTLTGGGTVNFANSIEQMIVNGTLTNANNTINGTGIMTGTTLTNSGTVDANSPSGPLVLSLSMTNTHTLQASNGGELRTQGDIDNTGGTIQALDKSKVTLVQNTIKNGTLTTSGTGVIQTASTQPLLDNVTNSGLLSIPTAAQVAFKDTITNHGTISVADPGNVIISGPVTFNGKGKVMLSNNPNNFISAGGASPSWTNTDNLIEGGGTADANFPFTNQVKGIVLANVSTPLVFTGGSVTNLGTLQVNKGSILSIPSGSIFANFSGGTLTGGTYIVAGTFQFGAANIVTNAANILLTNSTWKVLDSDNSTNALANLAKNSAGAKLQLSGLAVLTTGTAFSNAGSTIIMKASKFNVGGSYTQTGGITQVDGPGALGSAGTVAAPSFALDGGMLQGSGGFINAPVTNGAIAIAGDSKTKVGILNVSAYTQTSSGELDVQIKASPGNTCSGPGVNYSELSVQNGISLNGNLVINLINHPVLHSGDCFSIVAGSARTGGFANVKVVGGTQTFNVNYLPTGVQLIVP